MNSFNFNLALQNKENELKSLHASHYSILKNYGLVLRFGICSVKVNIEPTTLLK